MLTRRAVIGGAAAAAGSVASPGFAETPKDTIVIAMNIADAITLDPGEAFEFSNTEVCNNIYERLVRPNNVDPSKLDGVLAETWNVEASRIFTFKLKADHKFASGKPVTAADAAFSLQRAIILNKNPAVILTQFGFSKDNAEKLIRAADEATLVIELPEPVAPSFFLNCLSANVGSVVDMATVMANAANGDYGNGWLKQNSAGSGPYQLRTWRPSDSFVLEANPNAATKPSTRRAIIRHMPEPGPQELGLQQGDIDFARGLPAQTIEKLEKDPAYRVLKSPRASLVLLAMSQTFAPWKNPDVRQAVKFAIDYDGIQKNILKDGYRVHQSHQPIGFPSALTDRPYSRQVDIARELLKKSGFEQGFEVDLDYSNAFPYGDLAQVLQENLADIGIRFRMMPGESRQVLTKFRNRNSQLYLGRVAGDFFDPHTNADWFLHNPDNSDSSKTRKFAWRMSWDTGKFSEQVVAAAKEQDTGRRLKMYEDLQREDQQVSPVVYMFQEVQLVASRANVSGLDLGLLYDSTRYDRITKS